MNDQRKAKIRWRSRRGMLELDVLLERFIEARLDTLANTELDTLESLLEEPDPDLYAWLMGYESPKKKEFAELVAIVRSYHRSKLVD